MRPQIVGVGPLFPEIQEDLGVSHAVVGLLGTIPVLCMGVFAPPAAWLMGRAGTRLAIAACLALIAGFGIARAFAPGEALLVALTFPVGIGMGLAGALMPIAVKERFPERAGVGTSGYVIGINGGAAIAAVVAVPIAHAAGGWRSSLLAFSVVTAGLLVAWLVLTRRIPSRPVTAEPPPFPPLRSRIGWWLVLLFATMSITFYGLNAWLPDAYVEKGWSESSAGALVGVLNVLTVAPVFFVSWLSDRLGSRRPYLVGAASLFLLALVGLAAVPEGAWAWVVVGGLGIGSMFPLVMTLPLDAEERPERVGALVGMMLGFGYVLSAVAPLLLGAVRDATGSFDAVLWLIVFSGAVFLVATAPLSSARLRGP
ncbi:MAG TPA: MFS transporter [Gaiellaceae bacterium]|nr:MFS transporter [Gaiellaceae bacterium]